MNLRNTLIRLVTGTHAHLYRLTDGRVGSTMNGAPVLLLTTRGRRTGKPRTTPLMRVEHGGRLHVIASAGGADTHPSWFTNLTAEPRVGVEDGASRFTARAVELDGAERDAVYATAVDRSEGFGEYQRRTERTIPVVRLEPISGERR